MGTYSCALFILSLHFTGRPTGTVQTGRRFADLDPGLGLIAYQQALELAGNASERRFLSQ